MVGKDEELSELDDEGRARVKLIAEKKRQLELAADRVRNDIKSCFERLSEALHSRERQLLRQVEAIHRQHLSLVQSNSELLQPPPQSSCCNNLLAARLDDETELYQRLIGFGALDLATAVNDTEPYRAEEYIEAGEDLISYDKSLKTEADEFDVSSVMRRKRDSTGKSVKPASINLNCTSCSVTCKFETDLLSPVATTSSKVDDSLVTPGTSSGSSIKSPSYKFNDVVTPVSSVSESPAATANDKATSKHNFFFGDGNKSSSSSNVTQSQNGASKPTDENDLKLANEIKAKEDKENASEPTESKSVDEINTSKSTDDRATAIAPDKTQEGTNEHPIQIQQWLRQILKETETEPIIHEIGQFSKIPNTRLYREFPVET